MVACNYHQRTKYNLGVTGLCNCVNHILTCSIFRLALYGSDKYVLIAQILHLCLHLAVGNLCGMGGTMTHEYKCHAIFLCCVQSIETSRLYSLSSNSLGNSLLVCVDCGSVCSNLAQKRLSYLYRLKFILVCVYRLHQLVVLSAVHQMGRLYYQILYAVGYGTIQSLSHIVNGLAVAGLDMVDDDLRGKGTSYGPVRICLCQSVLDTLDISYTAVIEGSTKAYYQQLVLADLVLVSRIILGSVSGVASEVIRVSVLALYQLLLSVCQSVPCFLGCLTVSVCGLCSLLNIDLVNQGCYVVSCSLICVRVVCSLLCSVCGLFRSSSVCSRRLSLAAAACQHGCCQSCYT